MGLAPQGMPWADSFSETLRHRFRCDSVALAVQMADLMR